MSLEQKVMTELKAAMKAKDKNALTSLRAIKSALLLAKSDGTGAEMTEDLEIKILQKLVKSRKDSLEIFEKQGREDLAVKERDEIEVISKFLPKQLDAAELETIIKGIVEQTGASGMKDMGKVMGMASKQLAGKADGKTISTLVKGLLAG